MAAETVEKPVSRKSRLGPKGVMAQALLEQGQSYRTVRKKTGVSLATLVKLKHNDIIPREDVNAVKQSLQDQFALLSHKALSGITDQKLKDADIRSLMDVASKAYDRSGLAQSPMDGLVEALSKFQKKAVPRVIPAVASPDNSQSVEQSSMNTSEKDQTT